MDTYDFLSDPRTLTLAERQQSKARYASEQDQWLQKLRVLAEAPEPEDDFPAFLLATAPFRDLAARLDRAESRKDLSTASADELQWFLEVFADYLRTCAGEDVFPETPRLTG